MSYADQVAGDERTVAELKRLRAEVGGLREQLGDCGNAVMREGNKALSLMDQNRRLREALKDIVEISMRGGGDYESIARAALAGGG